MSYLFDTNACIHLMKLREPLTGRTRDAGIPAVGRRGEGEVHLYRHRALTIIIGGRHGPRDRRRLAVHQ